MVSKFFLYLVLLLFLSNCGFKDKKVEENPNAITLFEKSKPIKQELNPALNIKISTITKVEIKYGQLHKLNQYFMLMSYFQT